MSIVSLILQEVRCRVVWPHAMIYVPQPIAMSDCPTYERVVTAQTDFEVILHRYNQGPRLSFQLPIEILDDAIATLALIEGVMLRRLRELNANLRRDRLRRLFRVHLQYKLFHLETLEVLGQALHRIRVARSFVLANHRQ